MTQQGDQAGADETGGAGDRDAHAQMLAYPPGSRDPGIASWVMDHGLNPGLFVQHLFINRISTFFALDVVVSAIVLLRFAAVESARLRVPNRWIVVLATFLVGVSLGLPLFLYLRERRLEQIPAAA